MGLDVLKQVRLDEVLNEATGDGAADFEALHDGRDGDQLAHSAELANDLVVSSLIQEDNVIRLVFGLSLGPFLS